MNYCAYCSTVFEEHELTKIRFTDVVIRPVDFKFCATCFEKLKDPNGEAMEVMRQRHKLAAEFLDKKQAEKYNSK